jgi:hypothetical protein
VRFTTRRSVGRERGGCGGGAAVGAGGGLRFVRAG